MNADRFRLIIILQMSLLTADVLINIFSEYPRRSAEILLILFIIQDFCIVVSLLVMCLTICNTYIFQVGMFREVFFMYKIPVLTSFSYLCLSLLLHVWTMEARQESESLSKEVTNVVLFVLQRFVGVWHIYFYKKTALSMSSPELYHPSRHLLTNEGPDYNKAEKWYTGCI
ncbi:transmembrane protein 138 [Ixodes scapularis]|uniref:transmembrane protein 138 n=1 Tax=Ixodes scapularis TaxID=6945 RepID=UPI001C39131E|nr:transmembrane protein 138 [Ixodes scapularis]